MSMPPARGVIGDSSRCLRVRLAAWRSVLAGLVLFATGARDVPAQPVLETMAAAVGPVDARRAIAGLATRADGTGPRGAFTTDIVSHGDMVRFVQVRDGGETALLVTGTRAFAREAAASPMQPTSGPEVAIVHGHDLHRLLLDLEAARASDRRGRGRRMHRGLHCRGPCQAVPAERRSATVAHDPDLARRP